MGNSLKILAIDTSCDETSAAVTENMCVLSNIIWSQASLHAKFGGVYPTLAQREHLARIDWVITKAIRQSKIKIQNLDAIAVTVGPGLAIALGVGIDKAKEIAQKYKKPLIPVNHIEGHLLSCLAKSKTGNSKSKFIISKQIKNLFPALGLVVSGGSTQVILAERLGKYRILGQTLDDALGEALDKGARLLGFGYPGGAILEKMANEGKINSYPLPIPFKGRESNKFSYSGLKTALVRLTDKIKKEKKSLNKEDVQNLAASYQNVSFEHLVRVTSKIIGNNKHNVHYMLVGGGVGANTELRKRIRRMCKEFNITPLFPYNKRLYTDNAAIIGVAAYLNHRKITQEISKIDRLPRLKIDSV